MACGQQRIIVVVSALLSSCVVVVCANSYSSSPFHSEGPGSSFPERPYRWSSGHREPQSGQTRGRRQAVDNGDTGRAHVENLLELARRFGAANRQGCLSVVEGLLHNCTSYTASYLEAGLGSPLLKSVEAYRRFSIVCTSVNSTCPVKCQKLNNTLEENSYAIGFLAGPLLVPALTSVLCTAPGGSSSGQSVLGQFKGVQTILVNLNDSMPVAQLLSQRPCLAALTQNTEMAAIVQTLSSELPVLLNTFKLFERLAVPANLELLQTVQFRIPRRVGAALTILSASGALKSYDGKHVNQSMTFLLCSTLFPQMHIRPCPWLCQNLSSLLDLAAQSSLPADAASKSVSFALLASLTRECAELGSWNHCLDRACDKDLHVCQNGSKPALAAEQAGSGYCLQSVCPAPLRTTVVEEHRLNEIQTVLRDAFKATSVFLPEFELTLNTSVLPCGMDCVTFTLGKEEEVKAQRIIAILSWTLFVLSLLSLLTFVINSGKMGKYPSIVFFFCNTCSALGNMPLWIQSAINRDSYLCHADGTLRIGEPTGRDDSSWTCIAFFTCMTYFSLAGLYWWMALTHSWYVTFYNLDKMRSQVQKRHALYLRVYHLVAWTVPAIQVSVILALKQVDAVPLIGICFSMNYKVIFYTITVPVIVVGSLGLPYLAAGSYQLVRHKKMLVVARSMQMKSKTLQRSEVVVIQFLTKTLIILLISFANMFVSRQFNIVLVMRRKRHDWTCSPCGHRTPGYEVTEGTVRL